MREISHSHHHFFSNLQCKGRAAEESPTLPQAPELSRELRLGCDNGTGVVEPAVLGMSTGQQLGEGGVEIQFASSYDMGRWPRACSQGGQNENASKPQVEALGKQKGKRLSWKEGLEVIQSNLFLRAGTTLLGLESIPG